jgi:hypothetical protein
LPIGWVLEGENKYVAGYLGNIPRLYKFQNRTILASVAHSWVVDSQYRSYALSLLEEYFSQNTIDLFLNTTVGPAAADSFAVFQSVPVPVGKWDHSSFWITNNCGFIEGWLAKKGIRLAKAFTYALALGPWLKQAFSGSASARIANGRIRVCEEFDDRFDIFWDRLQKQEPQILRAVRDREFLNWHFQYALRERKVWILAGEDSSGMTTYGIFLRQDNPKYGLSRVRLVDFQTLNGSAAFLVAMLSWSLKRCRREGVHMLECVGFRPDKQNVITTLAPYQRTLPSWLYFYKTTNRDLAQKLSDPNAWDPSQFDGDASL